MNMPVPNVGVDPGPDWANNINACLSIIDGHNHALGTGIQINPDGININADLVFNDNNGTEFRAVRFSPQGTALVTPADVGQLYEVGVDLYYNDGAGNVIRITQGGTVTGATGTITGLPSGTASASYAAGTFVFESATNLPATLDAGSVIIRDETAGGNGITLQAPNSLPGDYSVTLPLLPSQQEPVTIDNAGNMKTQRQLVWDIVVNSNLGSGGVGDYATISAAISAATAGQSILIMTGTYTENVVINKLLTITGLGVGTVVNGSVEFAVGSSDSLMQDFSASGITIDSGVVEASVISFWNASGFKVIDNGSGSFIQGMQE
jgi:hypothetical protein